VYKKSHGHQEAKTGPVESGRLQTKVLVQITTLQVQPQLTSVIICTRRPTRRSEIPQQIPKKHLTRCIAVVYW